MKPWLKKVDAMKREAFEKANKLTAARFRQQAEVRRRYEEAIRAGKLHGEATLAAVKGTKAVMGHSQAHLRGWFISLSLDESEDDYKWRWRVSVSRSGTIGSDTSGDTLELKEIIERLGGTFEEPYLTPERNGTKAVHWRWDHTGEPPDCPHWPPTL
jgi:hypothetical protein